MTTSQQAKIRRAKGTDVVNLYRLLVAEAEQHPFVSVDETLALGSVLAVIEKGLVVVAEHSGRLVGSIGFDIYRPSRTTESLLDNEWFIVVPAYEGTTLGSALLKRALAIVDEYGIRVRLQSYTAHGNDKDSRRLKAAGFKSYATSWLRQNKKLVPDEDANTDAGKSDSGTGPDADAQDAGGAGSDAPAAEGSD